MNYEGSGESILVYISYIFPCRVCAGKPFSNTSTKKFRIRIIVFLYIMGSCEGLLFFKSSDESSPIHENLQSAMIWGVLAQRRPPNRGHDEICPLLCLERTGERNLLLPIGINIPREPTYPTKLEKGKSSSKSLWEEGELLPKRVTWIVNRKWFQRIQNTEQDP